MTSILIIKTAALGDVLRTTSILPGLKERYPGCHVTWVTAHGAADLVRTHPMIDRVETLTPGSQSEAEELAKRLSTTSWTRVISLDDEPPLCWLASQLGGPGVISGAYSAGDGKRSYTPDTAPWFDMGLLSVHGKERADRMKVENTRSQPLIYAEMLGIRMGKPMLVLPDAARAFGKEFAARHGLAAHRPVIGLNTGAGGRWLSKQLPVERTVEVARLIAEKRGGCTFVVFGGGAESERNRAIVSGATAAGLRCVDAGCDNGLFDFAALVELCDLLITSDSLALHVALSLDVRVVCFFAPTSAAEIELYGLGEKVVSTAPDYCSYRADADNSTVTADRVASAALGVLAKAI